MACVLENNLQGCCIAKGSKEKGTFFGSDCGGREDKLVFKKRIHFLTAEISNLPFSTVLPI